MAGFTRILHWLKGPAGHPAESPVASEPDPTPQETGTPAQMPPSGVFSIPNYQLIRCIGKGAYGDVWIARNELGVCCAVKIVERKTFPDRSPFEREYRGILHYTPLSRTHHGLVQILHIGRDNDAGYFHYVMELADCQRNGRQIDPAAYLPRSLASDLDQRGRLTPREGLLLAFELTEALCYLHSRQLIHRDIKPSNIIYVNGMAKLADVGLVVHVAEARNDSKNLGTEGFVPPEGPGTPSADVYSLGKVLSEAVLGYTAAPPSGVGLSLGEIGEEWQPFREVILKAANEDQNLRHQSVAELQAELMQLSDLLERTQQ
jgi:serine/threonine protein kinase